MNHTGQNENVTGIDIGCGASCIYCLLSVKMNSDWKMFALELDEANIKFAQENIERNNFADRITVVAQNEPKSIFDKLFKNCPAPKTFCLCNPPFYSSEDEVINSENRTGKRKMPKSLNSGTSCELVFADGGELGFVRMILAESIQLKEQIEIFTTMLGCKKNLEKILDDLKSKGITSCTTAEFVQGKTMRWGVAWSFKHDLKSFVDQSKMTKKDDQRKNILQYVLFRDDFEGTAAGLKQTFSKLEIDVKVIEEVRDELHRWELHVRRNTWSNQRRKRRAEQKKAHFNDRIRNSADTEKDMQIGFEMRNDNESITMSMFYISGTMEKDSVNQIMQFIKNQYK